MEEESFGLIFTRRDLPRWLAALPRPGAIILWSMSFVSRRASRGRWSARRTLAFIVVASTLLWAMIIGAGVWLVGLIRR